MLRSTPPWEEAANPAHGHGVSLTAVIAPGPDATLLFLLTLSCVTLSCGLLWASLPSLAFYLWSLWMGRQCSKPTLSAPGGGRGDQLLQVGPPRRCFLQSQVSQCPLSCTWLSEVMCSGQHLLAPPPAGCTLRQMHTAPLGHFLPFLLMTSSLHCSWLTVHSRLEGTSRRVSVTGPRLQRVFSSPGSTGSSWVPVIVSSWDLLPSGRPRKSTGSQGQGLPWPGGGVGAHTLLSPWSVSLQEGL